FLIDRTAFGPRSQAGLQDIPIGRDQSATYSFRRRPPRGPFMHHVIACAFLARFREPCLPSRVTIRAWPKARVRNRGLAACKLPRPCLCAQRHKKIGARGRYDEPYLGQGNARDRASGTAQLTDTLRFLGLSRTHPSTISRS